MLSCDSQILYIQDLKISSTFFFLNHYLLNPTCSLGVSTNRTCFKPFKKQSLLNIRYNDIRRKRQIAKCFGFMLLQLGSNQRTKRTIMHFNSYFFMCLQIQIFSKFLIFGFYRTKPLTNVLKNLYSWFCFIILG